jgi:hypothetical protein
MQITSKVTSDMKQITNMMSRLNKLNKTHVEYGFFEDQIHQGSGKPMSELATLLNNGTRFIPERPFADDAFNSMQRWMDVNNGWKTDVWRYLKNGGRIDVMFKKYGQIGADTIRAMMNNNNYADNVAWWEKMKQEKYGLSMPLIETHELYDGAIYRIIRGGK